MVACGGLRKRDEGFELGASRTGINGLGGEAHAFEKIRGAAGGDQRGRGIRENDIAVRPMLAVGSDARPKTLWMISALSLHAAANRLERRATQAEILADDVVAACTLPRATRPWKFRR